MLMGITVVAVLFLLFFIRGWQEQGSDFWFQRLIAWIWKQINEEVTRTNTERKRSRQLALNRANNQSKSYSIQREYYIKNDFENRVIHLKFLLVFNLNQRKLELIESAYGSVFQLQLFMIAELQSVLHRVLKNQPINNIIYKLTTDQQDIKSLITQKLYNTYGYYIKINDVNYLYNEDQFLPQNLKALPELEENIHFWAGA